MSIHKNDTRTSAKTEARPRALFVTTVPITLTSFLLPWAHMLKTDGWSVDCATSNADSEPRLLENFEQVFSVDWSRSPRSLLRYPALARRINSIVSKNAYNVVHVHTPIAAFITRLALRRMGRFGGPAPKIIYTAHGFHFHKGMSAPLKGRLFRLMERLALCWTDVLVVMNDEDERAAQSLRFKAKCPVRKVCLVQMAAGGASKRCARTRARIMRIDGVGFDFAAWEELRMRNVERLAQEIKASDVSVHEDGSSLTSETSPARVIQLVMIAEFNLNKRHVPLLFELAKLRQQGYAFHLTLIGSGEGQPQIEAAVEELGLTSYTTFTGQIIHDEIAHILTSADVGLLVSEREGLPRSLMELIAGGIVVAGTPTRGIIEEVADSRAIAPLSQSGAFGKMLASLMDSPTLRAELHQIQYNHARSNYDLPLVLEQYRALYRNLISEKDSPCA